MSQASTAEQIEDLRSRALADLESAPDLKSLDEWRVSFMGRRGELTQLLRGLGSLPAEERPRVGAAANALRQTLQQAMSEREAALKRAAEVGDAIDVTLPGWPIPEGRHSSHDQDGARDMRGVRVDGLQRSRGA